MRLRDIEVSTTDLAAAFGISTRHINNLAERGHVKRVGHGRYLLHESIGLYVAHLHEAAEARGGEAGVSNLTEERARLAREQANGLALKNAALRNSLVSAAEADAACRPSCAASTRGC